MLNSVKARFVFLVITSLLAMLILILGLKLSLDKLSLLTKLDKKIENIHSGLFQLRMDEKNFFIRRELTYIDDFEKDFISFQEEIATIKVLVQELSFNGKKLNIIIESAKLYQEAFKNISDAYILQGLDHNLGLRGTLRKDAHALEQLISKPKLKILLLQMRRAEKDFFSRKKLNFFTAQKKYYSKLKTLLTTQKEQTLLENYEKSFTKAYNLRLKIGIDNNQGYVKQMLLSAQEIELQIDKGTQMITPYIQQERENLKDTTYTVFIFTALFLILIIFFSARKLTIAFEKFITFFKEAKSSHSRLHANKADFTEFTKLSVYANEMIEARVKAEDELHDLNLHLEERVEEGIKEIKGLNQEIVDTQKEVVFTMGAIGESRSKETGNHVKRVAQYSYILAKNYGLSQHQCDVLREASPMHDIGKIGIPDAVLNKPGRFNDEERAVIETHTALGYEMLKHSKRELLLAAATVSYEHHEKWNGTGYPRGLKEEEIHIYGRITALADVFDALGSDRVYKKAWDDERIFTMFKEERAEHFDPKVVDCFFKNLDEILEVRDRYKDIYEEV